MVCGCIISSPSPPNLQKPKLQKKTKCRKLSSKMLKTDISMYRYVLPPNPPWISNGGYLNTVFTVNFSTFVSHIQKALILATVTWYTKWYVRNTCIICS